MEKVILVGLKLPETSSKEIKNSLSELESLARTAGAIPVNTVVQNRDRINPAYFIGQGKALEIKELLKEKNVKTVIFDEDLKPVQQRNLEELIGAKIIGRTRLILDIFAKRARSKEGMLQVELAQLDYLLPRITERFGRFEQQTGGIGARGGIGTRGPGERKLEVDQRRVRDRIVVLHREIENLKKHRQITRQKRIDSGDATIAIVGYTNVGKSSLLNALSKSHEVYADNLLFATLDPTTRQVVLPGGRTVLFTDTVGFIRKLPHSLVAAFKSTLEEIKYANCIVHLIDASQEAYKEQVQTTLDVLKDMDAQDIPILPVYNKTDLIAIGVKNRLRREKNILISAKTKEGLNTLLAKIEEIVIPKFRTHKFLLPYDRIKDLSRIFKLALIQKQNYTDKGIRIEIKCTQEHWEQIKPIITN
ncbi:MAG: GTPase HflX [Elusimicrobia bacterium]|nr:GTPase HflX [Candidatus Liberimonas magnetica]